MGILDPTYCSTSCALWRGVTSSPGMARGFCACDSVRRGERYALDHGGTVCGYPDVRLLTKERTEDEVRDMRRAD